jgi:hypothetical protein
VRVSRRKTAYAQNRRLENAFDSIAAPSHTRSPPLLSSTGREELTPTSLLNSEAEIVGRFRDRQEDYFEDSATTDPILNGLSSTQGLGHLDLAHRETPPADRSNRSYLGQFGFMPIFSWGNDLNLAAGSQFLSGDSNSDAFTLPVILRESFNETYLEYCYPWCPVLEKNDMFDNPPFADSGLLQQALGLAATKIKPLVVNHTNPSTYYDRFKSLFYGNREKNPLVRIISIILIYWWSAGPPDIVSMDSQYWWTSVAIRLAQEIGLHREPIGDPVFRPGETLGLRRRIWWTLYVSLVTHSLYSK